MVFDLVDTAGDERDAAMPYHVGDESGLFVRRLSRFGFNIDSEGPAVRKAPRMSLMPRSCAGSGM